MTWLNNDEICIDIRDVLELRKLLLGIYDELPSNESWVLIDQDYNFAGINPYMLPSATYGSQEIYYENLNSSHFGTDFIGVKDGDAVPNAFMAGETRSGNEALKFNVVDQMFSAGELVNVIFSADNFDEMTAYQLTFGFDPSVLEYASIGPGALNVGEGNFGTQFTDRGMMSAVWYTDEARTEREGQQLFTIMFKAKQAGQLSQVLNVGSSITEALAFSDKRGRTDIELRFTTKAGQDLGDAFALFQNSPNPFIDETTIGYILPEAGQVVLRLFDADGKDLGVITTEGQRGYNEIALNRKVLPTDVNHVVYYQLEAENYLATKKMVVVK